MIYYRVTWLNKKGIRCGSPFVFTEEEVKRRCKINNLRRPWAKHIPLPEDNPKPEEIWSPEVRDHDWGVIASQLPYPKGVVYEVQG